MLLFYRYVIWSGGDRKGVDVLIGGRKTLDLRGQMDVSASIFLIVIKISTILIFFLRIKQSFSENNIDTTFLIYHLKPRKRGKKRLSFIFSVCVLTDMSTFFIDHVFLNVVVKQPLVFKYLPINEWVAMWS